MCGIAGYNFKSAIAAPIRRTSHRGPDNTLQGQYGNFTLAHNRLSIIDLSSDANQPFVSACGNYIIVFNGEVYNYQSIRQLLVRKYAFHTNSDTEVVLYNYIEKGPNCLHDFVGMFAFGIYDIKGDRLFCARDRLGIKPFVYHFENGRFIFASEIKVILSALGNTPEINREALSQYLHYLYVPSPETMFQGIHKLPPGYSLTYDKGMVSITRYWNLNEYIGRNCDMQEDEALERLDVLLSDSVKLRMIADVELGSFLSGGMDSSVILYYMAQNSPKPVNTFTIGFKDAPKYDERKDARIMAKTFGTHHREIMIEPDAAGLLPKMVSHFDEPFGNPTALLIHELTKATKSHATVALAGDGGDEIFGGYPRYEACLLYQRLKHVPKPLIRIGAAISNILPEDTAGNHSLRRAKVFVNSLLKPQAEMYDDWVAYFSDLEIHDLLKDSNSYEHNVRDTFYEVNTNDLLIRSSLTDLTTFLPSNLLAYGDAMSMANSFEIRMPLIDHRIVEFMTSLPGHFRIQNGVTKYLMKRLLKGKIPDSIINKPKLGLNPPMGIWLKKELRPLMNEYLSRSSIEKRGLFNYSPIRKIIDEHDLGKRDRSLHIWSLIVLEEWFRQYID
jgi:asparagine synthase (glutamine-hydrolysing)